MDAIAENVYIEDRYLGVTLGLITQTRGLIQIDAPPSPEDRRAWRASLMGMGNGPERVLIYLDAHPDRTLGVRAMDCTVIAHEKTAQAFRNRPTTFKAQGEELSPEVPQEEKKIVVDLTTQLVTAFEGEKMVFSERCASGVKGTDTPKGDWLTYHKGASVHMTNEGDAVEQESVYSLPGVPWCSFFTSIGNAFHGTYWHNHYGRPRSHGCVNLPTPAAKWIYLWTQPVVPPEEEYLHQPGVGTNVHIY